MDSRYTDDHESIRGAVRELTHRFDYSYWLASDLSEHVLGLRQSF